MGQPDSTVAEKHTGSATSAPMMPGQVMFIADWRIDPASNRVSRHGQDVKVQPKVMQVLMYLAERPGELVTRRELEDGVWKGRIVTDDALTGAIIKLRKAFDDDAHNPRIIETVSKSGYRLIAQVRSTAGDAPIQPPGSGSSEEPDRTRVSSKRGLWIAGLLAALVLLIGLVGLWVGPLTGPQLPGDTPLQTTLEKPSIAVLPFENLGGNSDDAYFVNGITEDLITDLSKVSELFVVAPQSVFGYRNSATRHEVISQELGVRYLITGSVRRGGDRVRINARLLDAETQQSVWAERYDRELTNLFALQDAIVKGIVASLRVKLTPDEASRLGQSYTRSVEAYDYFLRGLDHYARRSKEDNRIAKRHFEAAIRIDPNFARPYAALALVHSRDAIDGWTDDPEAALHSAYELVLQAASIDNSIPQVHMVQGQLELLRRNYTQAIVNAEHAILLQPNYADGYALLAWILHFAGRPGEALKAMAEAARLNPKLPAVYIMIRGGVRYTLGQYEAALADFERAISMSPTNQRLRVWLAAGYASVGRLDEAQWQVTEILALDPDFVLATVDRSFPFRDPLHRDNLLQNLVKAGLTE